MDGDRARDAVKVLEGPLTVESGLLARLVKRPDGTVVRRPGSSPSPFGLSIHASLTP